MGIDIECKKLLRNVKLRMITEDKVNIEEINELSLVNKNFLGEELNIDLEEIYKLKSLKKLSIKFFTINDKIIEALNTLENLEILEIYMCRFETTETLKGNIKNIYIYNAENFNLDILETNLLEIIRIENSGLVDLYKFAKFESLKRLEIVKCQIISFPRLNLLKSLEELYLQEIDLQFDLEIKSLENLRFISLNGSKVDDKEKYIQKIKIQNDNIKVEFKNDNRPTE